MREAARRLGSLLRIHSAIEHAMEKVGVASCLIMAAHYVEGHDRTPLLAQHARDDCMQRPLSRRDRVRMPRDQPEARAAVVQQHAAFRRMPLPKEKKSALIREIALRSRS